MKLVFMEQALSEHYKVAPSAPRTKVITENEEVNRSQVILAAQDMVDKMQSMLEDTTEMQFKELPALVDSIRNQIGMDQATQFNMFVFLF